MDFIKDGAAQWKKIKPLSLTVRMRAVFSHTIVIRHPNSPVEAGGETFECLWQKVYGKSDTVPLLSSQLQHKITECFFFIPILAAVVYLYNMLFQKMPVIFSVLKCQLQEAINS